jgi:hypothetical protein
VPEPSKLSAWLATPDGRRTTILGVLGLTTVAAAGLIAFGLSSENEKKARRSGSRGSPGTRTKVAKGHLLCPYEVGRVSVNPQSIRPNDFVILRIVSDDGAYNEYVWGHVLSLSPERTQVLVELATPLISTGLSPINSAKHGFAIGEKVKIDSDCIYDVLHSPPSYYQILCGVLLEGLGYEPVVPLQDVPTKLLPVKTGDFVHVVVGNPPVSASSLPGQIWNEKLRVSVTSAGRTGDILRGLVWDDPALEVHGLEKFSKLEFTRDCIVKP